MNDEEPFLKRWSRRKIEAKEGPDAADPMPAADADARALDDRSSPENRRRRLEMSRKRSAS